MTAATRPRAGPPAGTWCGRGRRGPRCGWTPGPGTFANLQRFTDPLALSAIVLTHEHHDHFSDIEGFITAARWVYGFRPRPRAGVRRAGVLAHLTQEVEGILDWHEVGDGDGADVGDLRLAFSRTDHPPVTLADARSTGRRARWATLPTPGRSGRCRRSAPASTSPCARPPTPITDHEGTRQSHERQRSRCERPRRPGPGGLVVTHRWPTVSAAEVLAEATEAFGGPVDAGRRGPGLLAVTDPPTPGAARRAGRRRPAPGVVRPRLHRVRQRARSWCRWARPRCCARPRSRTASRPGCGAAARAGSPPSTRCCRGRRPSGSDREAAKGKQSGRTHEIQRLIGRSLRAVTDLVAMGELPVTVDCDVLQADGGTRTASICGAYVALHDCFTRLVHNGSCCRRTRSPTPAPRCRWASSTGPVCSTSTTPRTRAPRWT